MNDRKKKLAYIKVILETEKRNFINLLPQHLQAKFRRKSFICGGAIYSLYNGQEPKDFDFFLTDKEFAKEIYDYFKFNSTLKYIRGVKVGKYQNRRLVVTDNAISIGKYQIITRWIGQPEDVVKEFDFKHNMFYSSKGKMGTVTKWEYLEDNKLRFNEERARDIAGCIHRVNKFIKRGFEIDNKEFAKMLKKLHEVGFSETDIRILESKDRNDFGS